MDIFWTLIMIEHISGIIIGICISIFYDKELFLWQILLYCILGFIIFPLGVLYILLTKFEKFFNKRIY